jgi:hypothetical protein
MVPALLHDAGDDEFEPRWFLSCLTLIHRQARGLSIRHVSVIYFTLLECADVHKHFFFRQSWQEFSMTITFELALAAALGEAPLMRCLR